MKVLSVFGLSLAVLFAVGLGYLAYPGEPGGSRVLHFEGFILLPKHGALNVLDYLTLVDQTLFVSGASSGSVFELSLDPARSIPDTKITEWTGTPRVHGVALTSSLAFVTRSGSNTVDVFDPSKRKLLGRIGVADDPDAILYDRRSNIIYAASGDSHTATFIDPKSRATVATVRLEGKPEFAAIDPVSGLLYQNIEDTNALVAIDLVKRAIVGRWSMLPCQGPTGVAIDGSSRRLFVVCSRNSMMVVFDLIRHKALTTLRIGSGADSVAVDPVLHRIYTTGLDGQLTIIQQEAPSYYRTLDRISTHFGAHTLAVDPVLHRVYVGYASLFVAPRIAVFSSSR